MTDTSRLRNVGFIPAHRQPPDPFDLVATINSDSRGQWFILAESEDMDAAQVSGRWIKTTDAVPNQP